MACLYTFETPDGFIEARSPNYFLEPVDWDTNPEIRGTVISVREFDKKNPKKGEAATTRVLTFVDEANVGWSI